MLGPSVREDVARAVYKGNAERLLKLTVSSQLEEQEQRRERWQRVSEIFRALNVQEGSRVAEAVIAQYDTPRRQAEFLVRVIEASSAPGPNDAADLVPAELESLLRYSRYAQQDSAVLRGMESDLLRIGLAGNMSGEMDFRVRDAQMAPLLGVQLTITGPGSIIKSKGVEETDRPTLLDTATTVKDGETVVLGASKMQGGRMR